MRGSKEKNGKKIINPCWKQLLPIPHMCRRKCSAFNTKRQKHTYSGRLQLKLFSLQQFICPLHPMPHILRHTHTQIRQMISGWITLGPGWNNFAHQETEGGGHKIKHTNHLLHQRQTHQHLYVPFSDAQGTNTHTHTHLSLMTKTLFQTRKIKEQKKTTSGCIPSWVGRGGG